MEILFVIIIIGLMIALAVYSYQQAAQRRKDLQALADRLGWTFTADKDHSVDSRFDAFSCLRQGSNRYAYNMLQGRYQQHGVCAFDYHYETHSTDSKGNRQTHHFTFSALVLETGLPLKPLLIRPEGFFDKIGEFFGFDDIDFESTQFSREFFVKSPDRRWAFDVIHQATMEFLLAAPRFTIEFAGPRIITYRSSCFGPAEFESALRVTEGIIERLPNYLLREWKGAV